jgi:hypothetical protein
MLVAAPPRIADSQQNANHQASDELQLDVLLHPLRRRHVGPVDDVAGDVLAGIDRVADEEDLSSEILRLR